MKTIDCFIPYSGVEETRANVAQFRNCGCVGNIFLLANDVSVPQMEGCSLLFVDSLESSSTYRQIATVARSPYIILYTKTSPVRLGYRALERMTGVAENTGAGMIYSDH